MYRVCTEDTTEGGIKKKKSITTSIQLSNLIRTKKIIFNYIFELQSMLK